jgi:hypothetical protein
MTEVLIAYLVIGLFVPILICGFLYIFDYVADSDIWIKKEDREQ